MMESTVLWCCTRIVNRLGMILSEKERKIGWHRSDADFHLARAPKKLSGS